MPSTKTRNILASAALGLVTLALLVLIAREGFDAGVWLRSLG